jgi:hypothetical protein
VLRREVVKLFFDVVAALGGDGRAASVTAAIAFAEERAAARVRTATELAYLDDQLRAELLVHCAPDFARFWLVRHAERTALVRQSPDVHTWLAVEIDRAAANARALDSADAARAARCSTANAARRNAARRSAARRSAARRSPSYLRRPTARRGTADCGAADTHRWMIVVVVLHVRARYSSRITPTNVTLTRRVEHAPATRERQRNQKAPSNDATAHLSTTRRITSRSDAVTLPSAELTVSEACEFYFAKFEISQSGGAVNSGLESPSKVWQNHAHLHSRHTVFFRQYRPD